MKYAGVTQWLESRSHKAVVGGSNPLTGTIISVTLSKCSKQSKK